MDQPDAKSAQLSGCFVRLLWMAVGNLVLVLAAIGIVQSKAKFTLTSLDVVFWVTAIGLPAVRFIDIRFLDGKTSDSQPATMSDWRRYVATVFGVSLAMWLVAHAVS